MVTPVLTTVGRRKPVSYITPPMFRDQARRGAQVDGLTFNGSAADNDAALERYIAQASSWIDDHVFGGKGGFAASTDTIAGRGTIGRDGYLKVHPRLRPVSALLGVSLGSNPAQLTALASLAGCYVLDDVIGVVVSPFAATAWSGPIQFGTPPVGSDVWYQIQYQPGWPITSLAADVADGATQISVTDTTGIVANVTSVTVYAGVDQFSFTPTAVNTTSGPGLLTLPVALQASGGISAGTDGYPVMVSGLPESIINAAYLVTRAMIRAPGGGNINASTRSKASAVLPSVADDFEAAWEILRAYQVLIS